MSQGDLASAVHLAQSMVSAIECGRKQTNQLHIERIDAALNTGGALKEYWAALRQSTGVADYFRDVVPLHERAEQIRGHNLLLVPGLLQTEQYARTILRAGDAVPSDEHVDALVQARIERQTLLDSVRAPLFISVIDEAALCRPIGGKQVMREQLDRLLAMSQRSRVIIQVVPLATEHPPALDGGFQLIKVPDEGEILYLETRLTGSHIHAPDAVETYARLFESLRGVALPEGASRDVIARYIREFD
jgi:transcriptional regulator with XRE-family HTH domain